MNKTPLQFLCISLSCFFIFAGNIKAQTFDSLKTVQITATVSTDTPEIALSWYTTDRSVTYKIYRKMIDEENFGSPLETLDGKLTSWVDTNVQIGELYHYKIVRSAPGITGNGYITAGIETYAESDMGIIILVVDTSVIAAENLYIQQYQQDLINEGWRPQIIEVDRDTTVQFVKSLIKGIYDLDPVNTRTLVLIGHVPVPYSGRLNPDAHGDHHGAWPAAPYYADMDGNWTDNSINITSASKSRNHNVPGDGKFDQSIIPFDNSGPDNYAELETGRIDFANLNAFAESELELLEKYFRKNHDYRTDQFDLVYRGLIENNFASFEEAFGQNGLRDFATMFGSDSVIYRDYNNLKNEPYIWSYACGSGSYSGAGGINNVTSMANDSLQAIFTMHFGSYFGDWDNNSGNYLRTALGSGTILTNAWAGRPHWPNYFMAMGKNIGYSAKMAMNNPGDIHDAGFGNRWVHIALMGDPSLRMYVTKSPGSLNLEEQQFGIHASWDATDSPVAGYNIYARTNVTLPYQQLNDHLIKDTFFTHECIPSEAVYHYMVRAVELKSTGSGTFYNLSPGIRDSAVFVQPNILSSEFGYIQSGDTIQFINESSFADQYEWDFGDGTVSNEENPTHIYTVSGEYEVRLIARNECNADTSYVIVDFVLTSTGPLGDVSEIEIFPNPTKGYIMVKGLTKIVAYHIWNSAGMKVQSGYIQPSADRMDVRFLAAGLYYLQWVSNNEENIVRQKFIKLE